MRRIAAALLLAAAGLALSAAAAHAHSLVRYGGGLVSYQSADATSLNTLVVRGGGGRIEFRDDTVDGGMDPGSCTPGAVDGQGFIVQTFCPAGGAQRVRVDLGDREDRASVSLDLSVTLLGGTGADRLTAGAAADEVTGGQGNDALAGGAGDDVLSGDQGADKLDGGEGADRIMARDGEADSISCGPGADSVDADAADTIAADCETTSRTAVATAPTAVDDGRPPVVQAGAPTIQRVGRTRVVRMYATISEPGTLSASGWLSATGLRLPVKRVAPERVPVAGGGAELTYRLAGRQWRLAKRALRRGKPASVRLGVVGTDLVGNSTRRDARPIRLVRAGGARSSAVAAPIAHAAHPEPNDVDGDEVRNEVDNCPDVRNGSQVNTDRDMEPDPGDPGTTVLGDACDADDDADGVPDAQPDNCRVDPNPDQADADGDGYGDACPPIDDDSDGLVNDDDNCDTTANPDQSDLDGDDFGDACDRDRDGDRFDDRYDNCPTVYNLEPTDVDGDGRLDDQLDGDGDGIGTACDPDESVIAPPPPAPPPPVAVVDRVRPRLKVGVGGRYRLGEIRDGIVVRLRCSEACAVTAALRLGRRDARRLRTARVLARGAARLGGSGTTYAFVRLGRPARRIVRRRGRLRATLTAVAVDSSANRTTVSRRLTLQR
jgi:hypothetical protein